MAVVAACMHLARMARRVLKCVEFLHGQRIHVGAQADGPVRAAVPDDADHAGDAQAAHDLDAPFIEAGGDHVGGTLFFIAELGVGVDVAPDRFELGLMCKDGFDQSHSCSPCMCFACLAMHVWNYCSPSAMALASTCT